MWNGGGGEGMMNAGGCWNVTRRDAPGLCVLRRLRTTGRGVRASNRGSPCRARGGLASVLAAARPVVVLTGLGPLFVRGPLGTPGVSAIRRAPPVIGAGRACDGDGSRVGRFPSAISLPYFSNQQPYKLLP